MKTNQGTPKSMIEAIRAAETDAEIEFNIIEFIRNRMNVISIRSNEDYKAMKDLQALIEYQEKKVA